MSDHSKIEMREMPKVQYHDTNGDHVLDDRDVVTISWTTAEGKTVEVVDKAGVFAMTSDGNRNLVIELAKRQGVNTTLFAKDHPLKS
jgi:hypothetical protein